MSDERERNDGAAGATLTCAAGVTPERLSAWRDGLLPPDQAAWLAAHSAGCAACSERLRDYDQIGAALRGQVIPISGADPWPAMRQRLARERRGFRLPGGPARGGLGALVAAALLVALFAGLLAHQATQRPVASLTPTTTTAPAGVWTEIAAYHGIAGLEVAPSNPSVAYQILLNQAKGSPPTLVLRRTEDQGASWHTLTPPTIPGVVYPADGGPVSGFVSPLDPRVVYLIVGAQTTHACTLRGLTSGGYCQLELVSTDSGENWQPLHLPTPGLISGLLVGRGAPAEQLSGALQAQGARLYADIVNSPLGANKPPAPGRLAASDDGGVTWRLIDAPIFADGQGIYDFAPTPSGSTIYIASEPLNQPGAAGGPNGYNPPITLWSSGDAGATWKVFGPAPNGATGQQVVISLRAALAVGSHSPYLYIHTADYDGHEYIQRAIFDGSGAFLGAPAASGIAGSLPYSNGAIMLTTLPDGSLVIVYNNVVKAWLASYTGGGNENWRPLTRQEQLSAISDAFTQALPGGATRLWLVGRDTQGNTTVEYATLAQ